MQPIKQQELQQLALIGKSGLSAFRWPKLAVSKRHGSGGAVHGVGGGQRAGERMEGRREKVSCCDASTCRSSPSGIGLSFALRSRGLLEVCCRHISR
jgi:hypothetical protein